MPEEHAKPENPSNPATAEPAKAETPKPQQEIGGPEGPEPTRFGDWEKAGRCSDF